MCANTGFFYFEEAYVGVTASRKEFVIRRGAAVGRQPARASGGCVAGRAPLTPLTGPSHADIKHMLGHILAMLGLLELYIGSCWAAVNPLRGHGRPCVGHVGPSLLNPPVLGYVGLTPRRGCEIPFEPFFWAPLRESKPHQRLDILRHFMKSSMTLFGSLSGVFFWERCFELRIGYFMGLLWLVCIGLQ